MKKSNNVFTVLMLLLAFLLIGTSCKKKQQCEINATGTIKYTNHTSKKVILTLDGQTYSLNPGEDGSKDVSGGVHNWSAYTTDGTYTWNNRSTDVTQCETTPIDMII